MLLMVAKGWSTQEVAAARFVSPVTIRNQLESIYRKLGVHNRVQATLKWQEMAIHDTGTPTPKHYRYHTFHDHPEYPNRCSDPTCSICGGPEMAGNG